MIIGFNKFQFYGKIVILTILCCLSGVFIYYHPAIRFDDAPVGGIIFLTLIFILLMSLLILMTLQLFVLPNGVQIDEQNKSLSLKFLIVKPLTLQAIDIIEFCSIIVKTKSIPYEGILLRLENGKEYLLGDFNLQNFKPIQIFLEENNVVFAGHYKFSFVAYFIKYFSH